MRHLFALRCTSLALLAAAALTASVLAPAPARAQAISTASRSLDLGVFAGYSYGATDYAHYKGPGPTFGFDVTRYFHLPIVPSFEGRASILHSSAINEDTFLAGLRAEYPLKSRLHPYVDVLAGAGTLHFKYPDGATYNSDRSLVLSYGGGVDIDVARHFQAKLDAQYQTWNLGPNGAIVPAGGNFTLTPTLFTFGVVYHIPFRPHDRQRDFYSAR